MAANPLIFEATGVWLSRQKYEEAETAYQQYLAGGRPVCVASPKVTPQKAETPAQAATGTGSSLVSEMSSMRSKISDVLNTSSPPSRKSPAADCIGDKVQALEKDNQDLRKVTSELRALVLALEQRIVVLEGGSAVAPPAQEVAPPAQKAPEEDEDDDDDIDLFGSDDDDPEAKAEAERIKEERLKAYQDKKSKKPAIIAKSNLILDVKPWDDETDMKELEACVRSVEIDGLLWGASKFVAVGYGIQKLQISCVIEDEKVFTDDIDSKITAFEDYIQSMDIVAFNKV